MKIVMISNHSCIRVHKIALPLIERGHEVHLVARKAVMFSEQYKSFLHYANMEQCIESVRLHVKDADIFHVHNEPSHYVYMVKELTDKPVVLDAHDSYLTRSTVEEHVAALEAGEPHVRVTAEERTAFQMADAVNFVSESMKAQVASEFGLDCPMSVLPSYVPRSLYKYHFKEWMGGVVYEGRVTIPEEHEGKLNGTGAYYCDYLDFAQKAKTVGMDFHVYAGREDEAFKSLYEPLAFVHKGYRYGDLLDQISRHDWGLVGNTVPSPQWQVALPNKMFDYLAAGIPSVCINAHESSEAVREHGFGITVGSVEELAGRWREHRQCRPKVFKAREAFAMENHIHRLEDLYDAVA